MQLARVIGHATATVKHNTLAGWRLMIVQPLAADGSADGAPFIAMDNLGSSRGADVMITGDGPTVREMLGSDNSPARYAVLGLADA